MRIFTLTMNPAIDVSTQVDRLAPSRKLRCDAERRDPGGGGINVARVVRRLGGDVVAVFAAGGATGQLLGRLVQREGIPSLRIEIAGDTREDFTILERATNQQYRFVMPGPTLAASEQARCLEWIASLDERPKFLVLSGSLPAGVPADFYAQASRLAKRRGARVVLDTSGPAFSAAIADGVFLVKPNLRELRELAGADLPDERSWIGASADIVASGRAELVALSLAEKGAILTTRDGVWRAGVPDVAVKSVVGAGDSFLGGLVESLARGEEAVTALRWGVAAGSAAVLNTGTELCHEEDVHTMYERAIVTEASRA